MLNYELNFFLKNDFNLDIKKEDKNFDLNEVGFSDLGLFYTEINRYFNELNLPLITQKNAKDVFDLFLNYNVNTACELRCKLEKLGYLCFKEGPTFYFKEKDLFSVLSIKDRSEYIQNYLSQNITFQGLCFQIFNINNKLHVKTQHILPKILDYERNLDILDNTQIYTLEENTFIHYIFLPIYDWNICCIPSNLAIASALNVNYCMQYLGINFFNISKLIRNFFVEYFKDKNVNISNYFEDIENKIVFSDDDIKSAEAYSLNNPDFFYFVDIKLDETTHQVLLNRGNVVFDSLFLNIQDKKNTFKNNLNLNDCYKYLSWKLRKYRYDKDNFKIQKFEEKLEESIQNISKDKELFDLEPTKMINNILSPNLQESNLNI